MAQIQCRAVAHMQNIMSMPSPAHINCQALCKLSTLNMHCFVVNLPFVAFCALYSAIFWVKLDCIGIDRVRSDIIKVDFLRGQNLRFEILRKKKRKNHTKNHIICGNHKEKM